LRDRIDLVVDVPASVPSAHDRSPHDSSCEMRTRVMRARKAQRRRFEGAPSTLNASMEGAVLREHCALGCGSTRLLDAAVQKFCLSARGCDRVLRVSRTIADLADSPRIESGHVAEALQYRVVFA